MDGHQSVVVDSDPAEDFLSRHVHAGDALDAYGKWPAPSVIVSDDAKRLAQVRDAAWESINAEHRVVHPENLLGVSRNLIKTQARGEIYRDGRWTKDADNYGKLDRRDDTLSLQAANKTLADWRTFIANAARAAPRERRLRAVAEDTQPYEPDAEAEKSPPSN